MADLEASEDSMVNTLPPTDPTGVTHSDNEQDAAEDEPIADFRFLSLTPGQKIPARGTKDFEPHGTQLQSSTLDASRAAMHAVLADERFHAPGGQRGVYDPIDGGAWILNEGGKWQTTVGRAKRVPGMLNEKGNPLSRLWLLPEETLWLVERGSLDLRWPAEEGEAENEGLPMSLQAAYAMFVGKAKEGWLSLEKFTVYQGLKRAGYVLFRAEDNWHNVPVHMESAAGGKSMMQSLWALWDKTFEESEKKIRQRQATGPLVTPGLYRNYKSIYRRLPLIPYHDPLKTPALVPATSGSPSVHYHAYKANVHFKKTAPGPPDFYISVVKARNTLMFTESDFESLLRQTPFQPKAGNNIYQKLRLGIRKVILAVVDQGVTSYINIADAGFGNEKLHEREPGRRGGKQGGFRGKGRGRGRGRG